MAATAVRADLPAGGAREAPATGPLAAPTARARAAAASDPISAKASRVQSGSGCRPRQSMTRAWGRGSQ